MNAKITFILLLPCIASSFYCQDAFAQEIELTNIHTEPPQVNVGDSFRINATIVNNSTDTILLDGGCQSPLSASFDKNVVIGHAMGCFALLNLVLPPGHDTTVAAPGSSNSYTASSPGVTDARLTLAYHLANNTENRISKNLTLAISPAPVPEFPYATGAMLVLAAASAMAMITSKNGSLFRH
ncbi:MAG: hypothetical protein KGI33_11820 [Thaumarchaeota archaeon]|nr:hypothetical protein [Nitrososphaerota archaeon]